MYDWFSDAPKAINRGEAIPAFDYVISQINGSIQDVERYYHRAGLAVANTHILFRLLHSIPLSLDRELISFYYTAKELGLEAAAAVGMTTSVSYGKTFSPGIFYNKGTEEVIIAHDTDYDYEGVENGTVDWRTLEPLKVLTHPFTDLSLARLNGKYHSTEKGIVVMSLNVVMLVHQYRCWHKEERQLADGSFKRTHQFISQYPLTNVVYSHANLVLFNRMVKLALGETTAKYIPAHPFYVMDSSQLLDSAIMQLIKSFKSRTRTWDEVVEGIPAFNVDSLREAIPLPDVASTRQIRWALFIARLPLIDFLVRFNGVAENKRNQTYLRRLRNFLVSIKSDNLLDKRLSRNMSLQIDDIIYRDIMPLLD